MSMTNSIFSLTLDQFQTKSGKNLGTINIEEILNLLNEVNSDRSNLNPHQNAPIQQPNLSREPSFSIPTTLSAKTIEDILVHINKDHEGNSSLNLNICPFDPSFCQENLDSMTLEEFLVKLGIFKKTDPICIPRENGTFENLQNPSFNMGYQYQSQCTNTDPATGVLNGNLGCQSSSMLSMQGGGIIGQSCNNTYGNESGRKNSARNKRGETNDPLMVDVTDSKQRRMLKNRESAARSRARKQAYTLGIEAELTNLKQENEDLKFRLKHLNEHMSMEHKKLNKVKVLTRTNSL